MSSTTHGLGRTPDDNVSVANNISITVPILTESVSTPRFHQWSHRGMCPITNGSRPSSGMHANEHCQSLDHSRFRPCPYFKVLFCDDAAGDSRSKRITSADRILLFINEKNVLRRPDPGFDSGFPLDLFAHTQQAASLTHRVEVKQHGAAVSAACAFGRQAGFF
ncbi:hypothetical protein K491DRAFT_62526 [Lophiostoma macrostomum CBS 122681]|uniref:Uncharacterized protein n=1 Tax=Lophiostoma macrostomum CBS 122681 TaxID=1314788 RepID=A0A6A6TNL5_9PLEO|nr:hypothetical protein K491DRAFT_62526 [Lophiostoma macrostomum CBS 122681]